MAIKKEKSFKHPKLVGKNKGWVLVSAAALEDIQELLDDGFEPFAVDSGLVWLKKAGK